MDVVMCTPIQTSCPLSASNARLAQLKISPDHDKISRTPVLRTSLAINKDLHPLRQSKHSMRVWRHLLSTPTVPRYGHFKRSLAVPKFFVTGILTEPIPSLLPGVATPSTNVLWSPC